MELRDYPFFKMLESNLMESVERDAKSLSLSTGNFLYYQGDVCDGILFLKKGRVKVYLNSDKIGGGEITLYYIAPGEQCLVNTFSAISKLHTQANAVVDESIEGWLVSATTIERLIDESKAFRDFKISFCATRLNEVLRFIEEVKFKRVDERLLNWLFVQGRETIHATHEQIAAILGTSREVISRILKNFEKEGLVHLGRGVIKILGEA